MIDPFADEVETCVMWPNFFHQLFLSGQSTGLCYKSKGSGFGGGGADNACHERSRLVPIDTILGSTYARDNRCVNAVSVSGF